MSSGSCKNCCLQKFHLQMVFIEYNIYKLDLESNYQQELIYCDIQPINRISSISTLLLKDYYLGNLYNCLFPWLTTGNWNVDNSQTLC